MTATQRSWVRTAAVVAVYYAVGRLSLLLAIPPGVATPVWPASGLALAAVLLWGRDAWIGIWLGSFLVNIGTLYEGSSLASAALSVAVVVDVALASTLQALLGAWWIQRCAGSLARFERATDVFKFSGIEFVVCMIAPTFGVTGLCLSRLTPWAGYPYTWLTWWLGDLIGVLVVAPLVLVWTGEHAAIGRRRQLEALLLLAMLSLVGEVVFGVPFRLGAGHPPTAFLLVPFVLWAGFRFGRRGATAATLGVSALAIGGTISGFGQFARTGMNQLLLLQTFAGVVAVTGLAMAASLSERELTERELRQARDQLDMRVRERTRELARANEAVYHNEQMLRGLFDYAPDTLIVLNSQGCIQRVNRQAETMFGFKRGEITGQPVETLMPHRFRSQHRQHRDRYIEAPRLRTMGEGLELSGRRKDGSEFPVDIMLSPVQTSEGRLVIAIVRDITERRNREEELRQSQEQLRALAARLQEVREEERTGMAREIHDNFGQVLTCLKLDLGWMEKQLGRLADPPPAALQLKIGDMIRLIDAMVRDVRRLSSELRPNLLDDLGLLTAISWQTQDFQTRSGIACDVTIPREDIVLSDRTSTAVFRIYQEILTNVARHSGASEVDVKISTREDEQLLLEVKDNGRGITESQVQDRRSLGLLGMRERAAVFGGGVQILGTPGKGTMVRVTIPRREAIAPEESPVAESS